MQTNFDEVPGFSKKFRLKRYFDDISQHFRDTYCFDPRDFSNDNSLYAIIRCKSLNDNSLLPKIRFDFFERKFTRPENSFSKHSSLSETYK